MRPFHRASFFPILLALAAGCDDGESIPSQLCAPALSAFEPTEVRLVVDENGRLRDSLGREVLLRGLNTGGRSKFEPFLPFDIDPDASLEEVRAAADEYFSRLADWGLDTARMPFSWEALEPEPGSYDEAYLDRYEALIDAAWAQGLRVIVDFHQDIYASPFCGDGFPPWTVDDLVEGPPRHDCPDWFMGYVSDDSVREAFDRFWANENGVQDAFIEMWLVMAERFGGHPAVLGFELINEPSSGTNGDIEGWKNDILADLHERTARAMREVAPDQLIFYDNPGTDALLPNNTIHYRPEGEGFVYAPHYYDSSLLFGNPWSGTLPEPYLAALAEFGTEAGVHVLLGEFGYTDGVEGGAEWLAVFMDAVDLHRISATLWEYSVSEDLWNEEDLSVVNADGSEREILDVYVRPWLRALAGSGSTFTWDGTTGTVVADWTATEGTTEIVVPARRFMSGPQEVTLEGEGACYTWDMERSELRVAAPEGTEVSVRFHD